MVGSSTFGTPIFPFAVFRNMAIDVTFVASNWGSIVRICTEEAIAKLDRVWDYLAFKAKEY